MATQKLVAFINHIFYNVHLQINRQDKFWSRARWFFICQNVKKMFQTAKHRKTARQNNLEMKF